MTTAVPVTSRKHRRPAPAAARLGEHNEPILLELGYNAAEVASPDGLEIRHSVALPTRSDVAPVMKSTPPFPGLPDTVLRLMESSIFTEFATVSAQGVPIDTPAFSFMDFEQGLHRYCHGPGVSGQGRARPAQCKGGTSSGRPAGRAGGFNRRPCRR